MAIDIAISRNPLSIVAGTTVLHPGVTANETFPSMASINGNYTHFNQAIALYNRRTNQTMFTPDVMPYFTDQKINASDLTVLRTKINALRAAFALPAFVWSNPVRSPGNKIAKLDLDNLFSALNFSSVFSRFADGSGNSNGAYVKHEVQKPRGTQISLNENAPGSPTNYVGAYSNEIGGADIYYRDRGGFSFGIPNWSSALLLDPLNATIVMSSGGASQSLGSWSPVLYASNSNDSSVPSGWWTHLDRFCSSCPFASNPATHTIPGGIVRNRFGAGIISFVYGADGEIADSFSSAPFGSAAAAQFGPFGGATFSFNYGF